MATIYYAPSGCNCDNETDYTGSDIDIAAQQALTLASQGQTVGRDKYPHVYNDYEHFTFQHASKPYLEFPIFPNASSGYDGDSSPGADRVVIGSIAKDYSSAVFCAVITHDGSTKNGFTECKDDTVNQDGAGTYEKRTEGRGKEPGEGRKLLDRIDL